MGKWDTLKFDLGPITPLAEAIQQLADVITTIATIIKTATEIIAALAVDTLNAQTLLIQAALQAISDILNQFIQGTAALHVLVVPPRRMLPFLNDGNNTNIKWDRESNPYVLEAEDEVGAMLTGASLSTVEAQDFYSQLDAVFNTIGGNPAFGRTVYESLNDADDFNRPQYGATDAYYAVVILAGATSFLELFDYILALMTLFKGKARTMLPPMIAPPPQDLRVSTVSAPKSGRVAVRLTWNNPPTRQEIRVYDDAKPLYTKIQEVAIARTTDPRLITAKLWSDFFPGYQPPVLTTYGQDQKNVKTFTTQKGQVDLIYLTTYDGVLDTYVDDDAALTKGVSYYYCVAYRYSMAIPNLDGKVTAENTIPQNYAAISNVAKALVDKEKYVTHHAGILPDWDMTPNALDLIPDLKFFLALIKNYVDTMQSQLAGTKSAIISYIRFLEAEITRYSNYALAVAEKIRTLTELANILKGGIYVTTISGASGGTPAFYSELLKRLTDETDTTAPPFFRHGITSGMVLFAGAPNPAALDSVKALLALLFGLGGGNTALQGAIDSIDNVMDVIEATPEFTAGMLPETTPTVEEETTTEDTLDANTTTPDATTFDDTMVPVPAGTPGSNVPYDP